MGIRPRTDILAHLAAAAFRTFCAASGIEPIYAILVSKRLIFMVGRKKNSPRRPPSWKRHRDQKCDLAGTISRTESRAAPATIRHGPTTTTRCVQASTVEAMGCLAADLERCIPLISKNQSCSKRSPLGFMLHSHHFDAVEASAQASRYSAKISRTGAKFTASAWAGHPTAVTEFQV